MNKIKEIILAYATKFNPTEQQKEIAEKRLEICASCEFWVQSKVRDYCAKCGCTTSAKVFSPMGANACPEKRWTI
jgi:ribosomal protein L37E